MVNIINALMERLEPVWNTICSIQNEGESAELWYVMTILTSVSLSQTGFQREQITWVRECSLIWMACKEDRIYARHWQAKKKICI